MSRSPACERLFGGLLAVVACLPATAASDEPAPAASTGLDDSRQATSAAARVARPKGNYAHPISAKGRALDDAGKPIAEAQIFLVSTRVESKRIAETKTDAEGRYEFREVPLPIERDDSVGGHDGGAFELFGRAKGFGFAWRPQKWFYPDGKWTDLVLNGVGPEEHPLQYDARDAIELDLRFQPAAKLSGIVVDDRDQPLAGAKLSLDYCEPLGATSPVGTMFHGFRSLAGRLSVPLEIKERVTGDDGRFEFSGLPPNCLFRIAVKPTDRTGRTLHAGTTTVPQPPYHSVPVLTGHMQLTFATPREVRVKVVYGDTGRPAPKVLVRGIGSFENSRPTTTNDEGQVTLRLPPGVFKLELIPAYGTPYLITERAFEVGDAAPPTFLGRLKAAAVVEVTVVDADTGEGIADVDLWRRTDERGAPVPYALRSFEMETGMGRIERPRTDKAGKLRALSEPGKQRIGVGLFSVPTGYEVVESDGQEVELQVGVPVQLRFTMRKRKP